MAPLTSGRVSLAASSVIQSMVRLLQRYVQGVRYFLYVGSYKLIFRVEKTRLVSQ